jgi:hypothetical protein
MAHRRDGRISSPITKEQDDAQLGHLEDRRRVVEDAESERSNDQPSREVAQHGAKPQSLGQRGTHDSDDQKGDDRQQVDAVRP